MADASKGMGPVGQGVTGALLGVLIVACAVLFYQLEQVRTQRDGFIDCRSAWLDVVNTVKDRSWVFALSSLDLVEKATARRDVCDLRILADVQSGPRFP